jgi:inhibitor of cysteine peptidase
MHVVSRRHYRATQYRVSERARKRGLAREKCQLAGPKGGGWVYTQLDLEVPWCRAVSRNPRFLCWSGSHMLQFTASQTGESAKLPKGESFEISLPENPATGFRWKITAAGEPVSTMTGEDFRPSTGVGGQGIRCWRFRTLQAGESEIGMVLQRSWGAPAEPEQSFTLRVVVPS